jgi:hypothetical protein
MAEAVTRGFFLKNIVTDFISLYNAYQKTKRGKGDNQAAMRFNDDAINKIFQIAEKLETRTYTVGRYRKFQVYEPKERTVMANGFGDKVIQHSACDNVLGPCFSKSFIIDNYASQKGKGTHFGLDRLEKSLRHYYFSRKARADKERRLAGLAPLPAEQRDYADGYVLKADIKKFFYSIVHVTLYEKVKKQLSKLDDNELIDFTEWLIWEIIDSTECPGIPIGNQTSQLFALLYLNDLDHLIKDKMGIKIYGRYMDDFYIIHEDKSALKELLKIIDAHVNKIGLTLNRKTQIFPLRHGIDFLGFRTYLTDNGKVIRRVRKNSVQNMKKKIKEFRYLLNLKKITIEKIWLSYGSWCAHIAHGNTYKLREKFDNYFYLIFPELLSMRVRRI